MAVGPQPQAFFHFEQGIYRHYTMEGKHLSPTESRVIIQVELK